MTREPRRLLPVDPDCWQWLLPIATIGAIGWVVGPVSWIWGPSLLASLALLLFFRDPPRSGATDPGAVWSPADGKVVAVDENHDPVRGPVPGKRIAIFLSVLDCHINRAPFAGEVERVRYERGKFLNALDDASGDLNESNWLYLKCGATRMTVRQIAGLIARRIVCRVGEGQRLDRGQRIGLIRMGSRTELYLPAEAEIRVRVGQRVRAGQTVVAWLPDSTLDSPDRSH